MCSTRWFQTRIHKETAPVQQRVWWAMRHTLLTRCLRTQVLPSWLSISSPTMVGWFVHHMAAQNTANSFLKTRTAWTKNAHISIKRVKSRIYWRPRICRTKSCYSTAKPWPSKSQRSLTCPNLNSKTSFSSSEKLLDILRRWSMFYLRWRASLKTRLWSKRSTSSTSSRWPQARSNRNWSKQSPWIVCRYDRIGRSRGLARRGTRAGAKRGYFNQSWTKTRASRPAATPSPECYIKTISSSRTKNSSNPMPEK